MNGIQGGNSSPAVLLVENDALVVEDLAEAIVAALPGARVIKLPRQGFAAFVAGGESVSAAILSLGSDLGLRRQAYALSDRGIPLMLLTDEPDADATAAGWTVMLRPVFSDELSLLLRRLTRQRAAGR